MGYNLERWWAGWKQFVRRQGCAFFFGKRKKTFLFPARHARLKTPSLTLCSSNEHHSSVIKSNSHVFFSLLLLLLLLVLLHSIRLSFSLASFSFPLHLTFPVLTSYPSSHYTSTKTELPCIALNKKTGAKLHYFPHEFVHSIKLPAFRQSL